MTEWNESKYQELICNVLDCHDVEHKTEPTLSELDEKVSSSQRVDIYIEKTDTAIELKSRNGDLQKGIGQALNYTRACSESILMLDGEAKDDYDRGLHKTCQIAPNVHFAMLLPHPHPKVNIIGSRSYDLDIETDSCADFFNEIRYGEDWPDRLAVITELIPGYCDPDNFTSGAVFGDEIRHD
jgi:hypothetical protein